MNPFVVIIFLLCLASPFAVLRAEDPLDAPYQGVEVSLEELKGAVDSLETIKPEEYFSKIDQVLSKIDKYVEYRRHICRGEFSVTVLDAATSAEGAKRRKLSKPEQKACMSELKNVRILYANNLFIARKKYLDYLHQERINKLINIRDEVLKEIQNGSN